ncbi:Mu transposase domain-containing protein [Mycoavidus cysteinexigens]|uniref:Mu transposase domain-containing protein n=1 Tax=Mycoavidus cysteinexigens TaxID=1553431 RepID=UPI0018D5389E
MNSSAHKVSDTLRVDRNRYSVPVRFAGQAVSVRMSANLIQVVAQAQVVATHQRVFGRDQLICDPWHYLPVLEKKPGALRNPVAHCYSSSSDSFMRKLL